MKILISPEMIVTVVGGLLYLFTNNKPQELGRLAFACGLLALLI